MSLLLPYAALNSKFYFSAVCKKPFSSHPTFQIVSEEVFPSIIMMVWRLLSTPRDPCIDGHSVKYKTRSFLELHCQIMVDRCFSLSFPHISSALLMFDEIFREV